jgi:hypothetical protein
MRAAETNGSRKAYVFTIQKSRGMSNEVYTALNMINGGKVGFYIVIDHEWLNKNSPQSS